VSLDDGTSAERGLVVPSNFASAMLLVPSRRHLTTLHWWSRCSSAAGNQRSGNRCSRKSFDNPLFAGGRAVEIPVF